MKKFTEKVKDKLIKGWNYYDSMAKSTMVEKIEYELGEMENMFGLIILGSFVGLPSPPMNLTLDLLPEMEKHFILMLNKVDTAESPMSDLLSTFDVI
ncbi:MAG TPA: hypothetical protein VJ954_07415 [Ignavibacteriaceae bacterium]|nr:hypothetical protein [Ignavibacteriaceae bacterium]